MAGRRIKTIADKRREMRRALREADGILAALWRDAGARFIKLTEAVREPLVQHAKGDIEDAQLLQLILPHVSLDKETHELVETLLDHLPKPPRKRKPKEPVQRQEEGGPPPPPQAPPGGNAEPKPVGPTAAAKKETAPDTRKLRTAGTGLGQVKINEEDV